MSVWLVGAGGMLGRAFRARFDELGIHDDATGRELDVSDRDAVMLHARTGGYRCIVNCAAYTAVDAAESDEVAAMAANAIGPGNLGDAAREVGAEIVHFSTDYVFDGLASEPYPESALPNPIGAYGRSKLAGEVKLVDAGCRAFIIRTSWLFGEHKRNFVSAVLDRMKEAAAIEVVSDQMGRPTYCPDLIDAALALAGVTRESSAAPGVYHYANAGSTSWHGFATEILRQARDTGLGVICERVEPITTASLGRLAPRPAYSVLATDKIERVLGAAPLPWQTAVSRFLTAIGS